jgi:hypothetical protein
MASEAASVNEPGREVASRLMAELVELRKAAATCLRYIDGEVIPGLRDGRHTPEVVANIAEHQVTNLRKAIERSGALQPDGTANAALSLPAISEEPHTNE